jgi:2-polyprenyl-3-methyl-5-hydroxy-6-metoxy-1,4-benzoquinol methylase
MQKEEKNESIDYWNRNAEKWKRYAINPKEDFSTFPTSWQRGEIVVDEIMRQNKINNASILDLGCADGSLIMSLIDNGYRNVLGIDNSIAMVNEAKKILKQKNTSLNEDDIFILGDADQMSLSEKYDFISAIGVIEYLIDINRFFENISNMLNDSGLALIESRNKLFNLFSANQYTLKSDIPYLLDELEKSKCYSPITDEANIASLIADIYSGVNIDTSINLGSSSLQSERYPFDLPQYSPNELNSILSKGGLKIRHVTYYHAHPFPPSFQKNMNSTFNKLALAMQPLGNTPIAATMFSSFVATVEKS